MSETRRILDKVETKVNYNDRESVDNMLVNYREALYATQYSLLQCEELVCGVYGTDQYFGYAPLANMSWIPEQFHNLSRFEFLECFDKGRDRAIKLRSDLKALLKYRRETFNGAPEPKWGDYDGPEHEIEYLLEDLIDIDDEVRTIVHSDPDFDITEYLETKPDQEDVKTEFMEAYQDSLDCEEIKQAVKAVLENEVDWDDLEEHHTFLLEQLYPEYIKDKKYTTLYCIAKNEESYYDDKVWKLAEYWKENFKGVQLPNVDPYYCDRALNERFDVELPEDYLFDDELKRDLKREDLKEKQGSFDIELVA